MTVLTRSMFARDDFMQISPALVRAMGGDTVAVMVLERIRFRTKVSPEDEDGLQWWRSSLTDLAEDTGLSKDQVRRAIERLVERGVVMKKKQHEGGVSDQTMSYRVVVVDEETVAPTPSPHMAPTPRPVAPTPHHHSAPTPHLPVGKKKMKEEEEDRSDLFAASGVSAPTPDSVRMVTHVAKSAQDRDPGRFEDWWRLYPRKVAKPTARKAYHIAIDRDGKVTEDRLLEATERFAEFHRRAKTEAKFIPHPSTWLNQERWQDDLPEVRSKVPDGNEDHWASGAGFYGGRDPKDVIAEGWAGFYGGGQ